MMDIATLLDRIQRERTQALHYLTTGREYPDQFLNAVLYTDSTVDQMGVWPVSKEESGV